MRQALPKVGSKLKPGILGSLGKRRDNGSVEAVSKLLGDSDLQVAQAAVHALGLIGTPAAAKELSQFAQTASANMKIPVADARLICAEQLLSDGKKAEAVSLYEQLKGDDQPAHVKVAAMKGMLAAATRK